MKQTLSSSSLSGKGHVKQVILTYVKTTSETHEI